MLDVILDIDILFYSNSGLFSYKHISKYLSIYCLIKIQNYFHINILVSIYRQEILVSVFWGIILEKLIRQTI